MEDISRAVGRCPNSDVDDDDDADADADAEVDEDAEDEDEDPSSPPQVDRAPCSTGHLSAPAPPDSEAAECTKLP